MIAAAWAGGNQPARLQRLQRVAQDRPRHFELPGEFALAGQPVADADHALEDEHLHLAGDVVGGPGMLDAGEDLGHGPGFGCLSS